MNELRHAVFNHASNHITPSTDQVHMVEVLKFPYGRLCKPQRISFMRKGEEVGLNISKTRVRIYMRLIACQHCWNVIDQHHLSLRLHVKWWIRNGEASKVLDANVYT